MSNEQYTIEEIHISNILNAVYFSYKRNGADSLTIGGNNGQGKSSVLNAIWLCIQLKKAQNSFPEIINNGKDMGSIKLVLNNGLVITREFKKVDNGDVTIKLKITKDNKSIGTQPAEFLKQIVREISVDPMNIYSMDYASQRKLLLELAEINAEEQDILYDKKFEERRIVGVDRDRYKVQYEESTCKSPIEEQSAEALQNRVLEIDRENQGIDRYAEDIERKSSEIQRISSTITGYEAQINRNELLIKDYEEKIAFLKKENSEYNESIKSNKLSLDNENKTLSDMRQKHSLMKKISDDDIKQKIADVYENNRKAKEYKKYLEDYDNFKRYESEYNILTDELANIKLAQIKAINEAEIMEGLSINDKNLVCLNGIPMKQLSSSEKIMLAVNVAMKSNPNLKIVRLENASLFDEENRKLIKKIVSDKGFFLIEEVVGDADIVMENGVMKERS